MHNVRQILQKKGSQVWTISPDDTIFRALERMAEKKLGALLVTENDELWGIISERDYARKVILKGKSSKDTLVKEIMTSDVLYIHPDCTIEECMELMSEKRVRHLPVLEDDKLTGVISIGDVVMAVIEEKEYTIKQLENYIHGGR